MPSSKPDPEPRFPLEETGQDILAWLTGEYALQQELCDVLEEIADALPGPIDPARAEFALAVLRSGLSRHMAIQEHVLFPILNRRALDTDDINALFSRITRDNTADEGLAYDTADQLEAAVETGGPKNPDMLAYMLRGMFEGRRRHIAWELSVLVPLARQRLNPEDLTMLSCSEIRALLARKTSRR